VTRPLEGVRVIDAGTRIAAPFCAGLLGELGAEVIKVEQPGAGDFMRTIGPFADGYSLFWAVEGRGRKSVTCDLRQAEGQELFGRLAASAQVVVENFRPGAMEGWRLGPGDLASNLVYVRISAFGQDGPYSQRPGLDRMGVAYGGLMHLTGFPDAPPVRVGVTLTDYLTGALAASAAAASLYAGGGRVIDACLYGSALRILEWTLAAYDALGVVRSREGNRLANSAPLDNYPTSDGRFVCVVAGSDTNFARLCAAMGRPELVDDVRYKTLADRAARGDELNDLVAAWTMTMTAAEVEAVCIAGDVPVATVYTSADIFNDPHMAARGDLVTVDDPVLGPLRQQAPTPRLDGEPPVVPTGAPRLGEHNTEVWTSLGVSTSQLAEFASKGVI
jgi:crotonobetainyl-CoA:carnitine CoA-transferase CaiB-like acyl-CoA transferase